MRFYITSFLLLVSISGFCQKESPDDTLPHPAVTKTGVNAGKPKTMAIGKEGGIIVSPDGLVELSIPAGALEKKINISIQPISNLAPNGSGRAYRFEPSGIKFKQPVLVSFGYSAEEVSNELQLLQGISTQDESGRWFGLKNISIDTIAKKIKGNIHHFSDWSKFENLKLYPSYARLKVKKSLQMQIDCVEDESDDLMPLSNNDDLAPLVRRNIPWTSSWYANRALNGNATEGTLKKNSKIYYSYTAPAAVPDQNPVAISVDLHGLTYKSKGTTFRDLTLVSNILVYDEAYEVKMTAILKGSAGSELGVVSYKDTGSFVVSIEGAKTRVVEKVNKNASDELDYNGKCTITLVNPGANQGLIHITGVSKLRYTKPTATANGLVEIAFRRVPVRLSLLHISCPNPQGGAPTQMTTSDAYTAMIPAFPIMVKFETKEEPQVQEINMGEIFYQLTVQPVKEE